MWFGGCNFFLTSHIFAFILQWTTKELVSRFLRQQGRELAYLCCVYLQVCVCVSACVVYEIHVVIPSANTKFQSISQQVK